MAIADSTSTAFDTHCVRGEVSGLKRHRPLSEPIVRSTTFEVPTAAAHRAIYRDGSDSFYQRMGNPNASAVEERIALLERAEAAIVFGSGMGAVSTLLLSLLGAGSHVVVHHEVFAQTQLFLTQLEERFGVALTRVDARDPAAVRQAMRPSTVLIYVESPTNPLLQIVDIEPLGAIAREARCELVVDGTFASPVVQSPLTLGATGVLHSGTKFLNGHSDVMCGVIAGHAGLIRRLRATQILTGTVLDPNAAWLLLRGIQTLAVRVQRQSETALVIARFLSTHPRVKVVRYPWLDSHEGAAIARRQMRTGGGIVSFEPHGGHEAARNVLDALRLIPIATSLGGVETVIEMPYDLDFDEEETGAARAHQPALIRLSVGLEDASDLCQDLDAALSAAER